MVNTGGIESWLLAAEEGELAGGAGAGAGTGTGTEETGNQRNEVTATVTVSVSGLEGDGGRLKKGEEL